MLPEALAELEAQPVGRRTALADAVRAHRLASRPTDLVVLLTDALVPDADLDGALDELRISGRSREGWVVLSWRDSGVGMDEATRT